MAQQQYDKWSREIKNIRRQQRVDPFLNQETKLGIQAKNFSQTLISAIENKDPVETRQSFENLIKTRQEFIEIELNRIKLKKGYVSPRELKYILFNYRRDCQRLLIAIDKLITYNK